MNIKDQVQKMDEMVAQGAIVDAVKTYFSQNAETSDYGNVATSNKDKWLKRWKVLWVR